jgi:peptide deformylase
MILELVPNTDPILHTPTPEFDFNNSPINPVELYQNLGETMIAKGGIGLAAPQCGLPYRFFVLRSSPIIGMFNCRIVDMSMERSELEEGCLSYKNLILKIKRPVSIKCRWEELVPGSNPIQVETKTGTFSGMTARAIQHELDHVNGIVFTKHVDKYHLEVARNKAKKINKQLKKNAQKLLNKPKDGGKSTDRWY